MRTPVSADAALAMALLIVSFFTFGALAGTAYGCTAFGLVCDETVVGSNLDWPDDLDGYVLVNPKGLEKTFTPWSGFAPTAHDGEPSTWVSEFASITFTCFGRDFIEGGMNERGLIVEQASLASVYPADDGRPGVSAQQWMQYVLDTCQLVGDVVDGLDSVRQDGEGWHYLVVDRTGDWVVIEYLKDGPKVYRSGRYEFPVIVNAEYEQCMSHVPSDVRFGGELDIGSGDDSYARFVRVAERLRDRRGAWLRYTPDAPPDTTGARERWNALPRVEFAFEMLDDVAADDPQRSVVYDTGNLRVSWRSSACDSVRSLRLGGPLKVRLDTVLAVPVHAAFSGDATERLEPLSDRQNEELLRHVTQLLGGTDGGGQGTD